MKNVILWLWQLPQNILGLFVILFTRADEYITLIDREFRSMWRTNKGTFGVSLGSYVIIGGEPTLKNEKHEYGHQRQSLYLGWLYLVLIGLPSVCGNILHRFIKFDYYKQPWESWADKLGGVER